MPLPVYADRGFSTLHDMNPKHRKPPGNKHWSIALMVMFPNENVNIGRTPSDGDNILFIPRGEYESKKN
jgi:hypothetical protein